MIRFDLQQELENLLMVIHEEGTTRAELHLEVDSACDAVDRYRDELQRQGEREP